MDEKDKRIAELEALCNTLAAKLADIAEKLRRCLDRERALPCWRERQHLGRCGGVAREAWDELGR